MCPARPPHGLPCVLLSYPICPICPIWPCVAAQVKAAEPTLPALAAGSYVGVHLRHEDDWRTYCQSEAKVALH